MTAKTDNETQTSTIYQRRMEAKRILAKEKFVESNSASAYQTVAISEILAKVRKAHSLAGIILETNSFESCEIIPVHGNLNKPLNIHRAIVPFTWVNPDNPEDRCETRIEASVLGGLIDDKYVAKLYTSALKILYRIEYNISGADCNSEDIDMVVDADTANTKPSLSIKTTTTAKEDEKLSKVSVIIKPAEGIVEETKEKVSKLKVSKKEEN